MHKKIITILLFLLLAMSQADWFGGTLSVFATEVVDTAWVRIYSGSEDSTEEASAIAVDSSGNVYVTGRSFGGVGVTYYDYVTIKYHPDGDTAWVRRYNSPGNSNDEAHALALDGSGNVYVTGESYSSGTNYDYATIKYYPNGDTAWVRRYNGPGNGHDYAHAITVDGSGNVYVTGYSYSYNGETWYDYATIKYDPDGDTAWVRRYNGPGNYFDESYAIAVDGSGNVYVTGQSDQNNVSPYNPDYATIKYYSNGDTAWVRRYNGTGNHYDYAFDIAVDGSGNVYVTGSSFGAGGSQNDYATIKYDPDGDTAWVRRYNGSGNDYDYAYGIAVDGSGNVYVTGHSYGSGTSDDYTTIKYYPDGDTAWLRRYDGYGAPVEDRASAIALDNSGNVYVTGESYGSGTYYDYATIKYYPNGDTAWLRRYNGPADNGDYAKAITVDGSYNVYVTGTGLGSGTAWDYVTIKYFQYDSIPFAPAVNYPTGDGAHSVFCADLDNDGDLDIAVPNEHDYTVSILRNNGDGTFQPKVDYGTGDAPTWVFCADLDWDLDLDLALANFYTDNVSILKNNGDGTFQTKVDYGTGDGPWSVFCADSDGDLDLDLAVANWLNDNVSILKNNGDGTFQPKLDYGTGDGPAWLFCADLDGDLDLDLAVANEFSDNVSILKNRGDGTFAIAVNYGAGDSPHSVFCADLDGDNDLDLAVANYNSDNISILKNNGDGSFQSAVNYGAGDGPASVFCTDLDGDLDLDLVAANYDGNNVSILKNNGDGSFQTKVDYGVGVEPYSVFCADIDGDLDMDLAVADFVSDSVSILENLTQVPANQPPWAFSLISPADQDTIFGSIMFRWHTPYDPNFGDQIRYDLYVSTDPAFNPGATTIYDSLTIPRLTYGLDTNTYYWKVRAYDNWGAERWSTQTWRFESLYLTDTLYIIAFSPVDLIVTDPVGDSISLWFNTIQDATYDTTQDYNHDGDKDDIVTIPNRLVGDYLIRVVVEPGGGGGVYSLGIRIDGTDVLMLRTNYPCPDSGEIDSVNYNVPWYAPGDASGDWEVNSADIAYLINYLFIGGPVPQPWEAGDVNCDGSVNSADVAYLINYLFVNGPPPPEC